MKRKQTTWLPKEKLVITELSGDLDKDDIIEWNESLNTTLQRLPPSTKFKILVNLYGFRARDFEVHKQFRGVIPRTLAAHGWYVGYLRMFPEANVTLSSANNIYCVAAAHVHQDETKIRNYADNYSMRNERFFSDAEAARSWINSISVDQA